MNLPINLKIRKSTEEVTHRRTKTDYANIKKLIDNFAKQPVANAVSKTAKNAQGGAHNKTAKSGHNRTHNKSSFGESVMVTDYEEKSAFRKNETFNVKIDLPLKKQIKQTERKQIARPTQQVQKGLDRYEIECKVGSGTFGTVHKARDRKTLETVAIKKVYQDKKYKNRQLQILKTLQHPNILSMRDHFFTYQSDKQYLNVVMQYIPQNLFQYIQNSRSNRIPKLKFKLITYQLFRALLYLQEKNIAHRDIKPHNILIRQSDLKVIICDFGSAKVLVPGEDNISYICSRCYRAPELIFENSAYDTQVDVWAVGCVLVEMVIGVPVFRANSNLEQLVEIMKVLGTPTESEILEMNPSCDLRKFQLPQIPRREWSKILKLNPIDAAFLDLIQGIMKYSPIRRLRPAEVLQHHFFDQLRMEAVYEHLRNEMKIPDLFNFCGELGNNKYAELVPKWYVPVRCGESC